MKKTSTLIALKDGHEVIVSLDMACKNIYEEMLNHILELSKKGYRIEFATHLSYHNMFLKENTTLEEILMHMDLET